MGKSQTRGVFRWCIWLNCAYIGLLLLLFVFQVPVKRLFGAPPEIAEHFVADFSMIWLAAVSAAAAILCICMDREMETEKEAASIMVPIAAIVLFTGFVQSLSSLGATYSPLILHYDMQKLASVGSLSVPKAILGVPPLMAQNLLLTQAGYFLGKKGVGNSAKVIIPAAWGVCLLAVIFTFAAARFGSILTGWSPNYHDYYDGNVFLPTDAVRMLVPFIICGGLTLWARGIKMGDVYTPRVLAAACGAAAFLQGWVVAALTIGAHMWFINARGSSYIAAHTLLARGLIPAGILADMAAGLLWVLIGVNTYAAQISRKVGRTSGGKQFLNSLLSEGAQAQKRYGEDLNNNRR